MTLVINYLATMIKMNFFNEYVMDIHLELKTEVN